MNRQKVRVDIQNYERKYEKVIENVLNSDISKRNKDLILQFRDACLLHNVCGKPRLIRVMGILILYAKQLKKDFDKVNKEDLKRLLAEMLSRKPPYSPETMSTNKAILRRYMSWVLLPDEFPNIKKLPDMVSWINSHVRQKDINKLQRNDLLSPSDIEKLLHVCHNPRDKALIAMLWEIGTRISEIGNLQIKHINKTEHGFLVDLSGKTGQRTPLIISSAPYLSQWLSLHPFKDIKESPLWVHYQYKSNPQPLMYETLRGILMRHFKRANIQKPYNAHIFRHSRATFVLSTGIMNETQAKAFFGWTPDSPMISRYAHLIDQDANNAILRENGLTTEQKKHDELKPIKCRICGELNLPNSTYCFNCSAVLDLKKAYVHQKVHEEKDALFTNLFKVLVDKGLINEAACEIHKAGLGVKLKCLAKHVSQERSLISH